MEAAVPGVLVHLCPGLGVGEVQLRAVGDRGREGRAHRHAGYLPLMNTTPPQPEQLVSEVKAGPGGAMTDEVGIITGDLTVATRLLPDGRADIAIQYTGGMSSPVAPPRCRRRAWRPCTSRSWNESATAAAPKPRAERAKAAQAADHGACLTSRAAPSCRAHGRGPQKNSRSEISARVPAPKGPSERS